MGSGYIVQRGGGKDYSSFKAIVDGSLTEVTAEMLDGVTKINNSAFSHCDSLASITISSSVTSISSYAFDYCISLTSIIIPSNVTSIGTSALRNCSLLTSVTVEAATPPTLGTTVFQGTHANLVIYVPAGSVDTYKAASGWSDYALRIQAIPST